MAFDFEKWKYSVEELLDKLEEKNKQTYRDNPDERTLFKRVNVVISTWKASLERMTTLKKLLDENASEKKLLENVDDFIDFQKGFYKAYETLEEDFRKKKYLNLRGEGRYFILPLVTELAGKVAPLFRWPEFARLMEKRNR